MNRLIAWMNGERVGAWTVSARGAHGFRYEAAGVASERGRPLSLSLPFPPDSAVELRRNVGEFFDNLLPDSEHARGTSTRFCPATGRRYARVTPSLWAHGIASVPWRPRWVGLIDGVATRLPDHFAGAAWEANTGGLRRHAERLLSMAAR